MGSPLIDTSARVAIYIVFFSALLACNASTTSTTPTTAPSKPNASSTTISVDDSGGTRLEEATVTLSRALNGTAPSGTIIGTQRTGFTGQAVFNGLPPSGQICASVADRGYIATGVCRQPFPGTMTFKLST